MNQLKGACLFGQSGGPTSVINASALGVLETALGQECVTQVYGCAHGVKGILEDNLYDVRQEDPAELALLRYTPSSALGSCRYKLKDSGQDDADYKRILEIFQKYDIRYFFYNGGNDSMDTCNKISKYLMSQNYECRIIGVPKTIDNDLAGTDHCPGFGSAAKYIATSCMEIYHDANVYDTGTVVIVEIMGRNAGWLTGATALARTEECDGPDLIYLPEITFDIDKFLENVKEMQETRDAVVIAVSEGIKLADGRYVCELSGGGEYVDAFGHKQLQGTAAYLAGFLGAKLGCKTRSIEFSTLQRSASHMASRVDINEAFMVGGAAVKAADEGDSGKMIVIDRIADDPYMSSAGVYDVHRIANNEKLVPREWVNEEGNYITDEFINYIEPLIQGDYPPFMVNGLPQHLVLNR